ncbi:MAG: hypothetical protein ACREHC_04875 [Candidatus Levyibacteriota bacterium]
MIDRRQPGNIPSEVAQVSASTSERNRSTKRNPRVVFERGRVLNTAKNVRDTVLSTAHTLIKFGVLVTALGGLHATREEPEKGKSEIEIVVQDGTGEIVQHVRSEVDRATGETNTTDVDPRNN